MTVALDRPNLQLFVPVRGHIRALDGLRGLAITLVLLHHFPLAADGSLPVLQPVLAFLKGGWFGVDLFFVLSGFLITGILLDSKSRPSYFKNFYARRTLRIFPLYYLFLAINFIVIPLIPGLNRHNPNAMPWECERWFLFYGQNILLLFPNLIHGISLIHLWSLAVEEHFYLVWPAFIYFANNRTILWTCGALLLIALGVRIGLLALHLSPFAAYVFTLGRMDSLCLGAAVAILMRDADSAARCRRFAPWIAGIAAIPIIFYWRYHGSLDNLDPIVQVGGFTLLGLYFAAILILVLASPADSWANKFFCNAPLRWLGKYSYGIYVWSPFFVAPCFAFSRYLWKTSKFNMGQQFFLSSSTIIVSLAAAWVSYNLFEAHFLKLKRLFV